MVSGILHLEATTGKQFLNKYISSLCAFFFLYCGGEGEGRHNLVSNCFKICRLGHYTIPEETDEVCNWLTATLGLEGSRS